VQSTPLISRGGRILGVISTYWRMPHEPEESNLRLLDVLARQAADLIERVHSVEAVIDADRHKTEFLAMLAHELRNPLAPIRNALSIVRMTDGNREALQSATEMIERQVGHMVRLVDDLLDINRISRGKIELRRAKVELASVIHHGVEACRPNIDAAHQELTVELPREPLYLNADPARLAQVVGNLLVNASKFTDHGGRIWLSVAHEGEQAVIRVRDNGIGIPPDQLRRVFDMFSQVDHSLERSTTGLGIGLALAKDLVELHGGTVEAFSAGVGHGSEFAVRLPLLIRSPEPADARPTDAGLTRSTPRRILVVDDNRDAATSLAMLLKIAGHETHVANDGLEAFEAASTVNPDLVLLDIGLPKLNGYEVARRIRQQPWGGEIVLVALTGWGQDEDRQKSKDAGFNHHLVKPVEPAVLGNLLAELSPESGRPIHAR
jgi:signal transduction histidine kinase/ActR/RegA family two-component response regulator